jgi:hypothetical protein
MRRALLFAALSALLAMLGGTGSASPFADAAAATEGPFPAPDAVNAPPAAATLIFLGAAARLDRAADSASRIRVSVEGCPPLAASISAPSGRRQQQQQQQRIGRPAPQAVRAARALAALPAGAPATLVATGSDGAQKTLILALAGPPQVSRWSESDNATAAITISLEGDIVDEPKDVSLANGAAAASLHSPGRLTRSTAPGRLAFDGESGAAL